MNWRIVKIYAALVFPAIAFVSWPSGGSPRQESSAAHESKAVPCDQKALVELSDGNPGDLKCMQTHAWKIFTRDLVSSGFPNWFDWCAMTNEGGRTLNCPSEIQPEAFNLAPRQDHETLRRIQIQQFLQSFEGLRQISLQPLTEHTEPKPGKPAKSKTHKWGIARNSKPVRSTLFETSQVLFNGYSQNVIEECFGEGPRVISDGATKTHLGQPKCTQSETESKLNDRMIAIKPVWAVTMDSGIVDSNGKHHHLSAPIPVWVESSSAGSPKTEIEDELTAPHTQNFSSWNTKVRIALFSDNAADPISCDPRKDFPPPDYLQNDGVPLKCFYSMAIPSVQWNKFLISEHITPRTTSFSSSSQMIYVVLVGFHVITREIPEWTWQTFWWSWMGGSDPQSPYQADPSPDPEWSHYQAAVTYGPPKPRPAGYQDRVVFNPYLEASLSNGVRSNCFTCHTNATYHKYDSDGQRFREGQCIGLRTCKPTTPPKPGTANCDASKFLNSGFPTHFLWSLADTNVKPPVEGPAVQVQRIRDFDNFLADLEENRRRMLKELKAKGIQKR